MLHLCVAAACLCFLQHGAALVSSQSTGASVLDQNATTPALVVLSREQAVTTFDPAVTSASPVVSAKLKSTTAAAAATATAATVKSSTFPFFVVPNSTVSSFSSSSSFPAATPDRFSSSSLAPFSQNVTQWTDAVPTSAPPLAATATPTSWSNDATSNGSSSTPSTPAGSTTAPGTTGIAAATEFPSSPTTVAADVEEETVEDSFRGFSLLVQEFFQLCQYFDANSSLITDPSRIRASGSWSSLPYCAGGDDFVRPCYVALVCIS